jgi:putative oxidoreductase
MNDIAHKADQAAAQSAKDLADSRPTVAQLHAAVERLSEQMETSREGLVAIPATELEAATAPADLVRPGELDVEAHPPPETATTAPALVAVPSADTAVTAAAAMAPGEPDVEAHAPPELATMAPALVAVPPADTAVTAAAAIAVPVAASAAAAAAASETPTTAPAHVAVPPVDTAAARTVYRMVVTISALLPYALIAIVLRFVMALTFFLSGQRKIVGPVYRLDLQGFDLSVTLPTGVKDSTYLMFNNMTNLPIPSWFVAPVVSYAEFILPVCLILGFATRFAAIGLLIMTAAIQVFAGPEALWSLHIYWASILLVLISLGPGVVSIDHVIRHFYERHFYEK